MLPKAEMVRRAAEKLYNGVCTVIEHKPVVKSNHAAGFEDTVIYENVPCRLSFLSLNTTNESGGAAEIRQIVKLFVPPETDIKAGSKIEVTQNGKTLQYKSSGVPARYETHNEIVLEPFERWA